MKVQKVELNFVGPRSIWKIKKKNMDSLKKFPELDWDNLVHL